MSKNYRFLIGLIAGLYIASFITINSDRFLYVYGSFTAVAVYMAVLFLRENKEGKH